MSDRPPTAVLTVGPPPPAPPLTGAHGTTTHGAAAGAIEARGGQAAPLARRCGVDFAAVGAAVVDGSGCRQPSSRGGTLVRHAGGGR